MLKLLQTLQLLHVGISFTKYGRILHNKIEIKLWPLCVGWKAYLCSSWGTRLCTSWKTWLCINWRLNIATSNWRTIIIIINNLHINDYFCHDLNLGLATKAKAWKGANQECNSRATFAFLGVWESVSEWTTHS